MAPNKALQPTPLCSVAEPNCWADTVTEEHQMTVKDLESLYDYGYWANRKLFDVISQLTPEQFTRPVAGSYGSIRNTMVHVLSAEWGWLDRCGGPERGPALKPGDYPMERRLTTACS